MKQLATTVLCLAVLVGGCVRGPAPATVHIACMAHGDLMSSAIGQTFEHTDVLSHYALVGKLTWSDTGSAFMQQARDADVAFGGEDLPTLAFSSGYRGKLLASAGWSGRIGLVQHAGPPASRVFTVDQSPLGATYAAWAAEKGIPPSEAVQTGADRLVPLFLQGFAPAVMVTTPDLDVLLKHQATLVKADRQLQTVVAGDAFLQRDREAAERLMEATTDAVWFVATHRDTVARWMAADLNLDATVVGQALAANRNVQAHSVVDVQMEVSPETLERLQSDADVFHSHAGAPNPVHLGECLDADPVLRSHARFKGYYDPNSVHVVKP